MKFLVRSLVLSAAVLLAFSAVSCSKLGSGSITGPGVNVDNLVPLDLTARYTPSSNAPAKSRAAGRYNVAIDVTPVAGDSVFIHGNLADLSGGFDWQAVVFWGLLEADGTIDRPFRRQVAAAGEEYQFMPMVHRPGVDPLPMIGLWTVNGVAITAVDHSKYGGWFRFGVSRDGTGQAVILQLRDDFRQYGWYKIVVTGVEPDSVQYSSPVTGDLGMSVFASHSHLNSYPMIFDEANGAWVQFVWAKKGELIIVRPNKSDGSMWIPGVFLEGAAGQRRLLTNVVDIDENGANLYYPVFPAILNVDGTWTVPNPAVDNRFVPIVIGPGPMTVLGGRPD